MFFPDTWKISFTFWNSSFSGQWTIASGNVWFAISSILAGASSDEESWRWFFPLNSSCFKKKTIRNDTVPLLMNMLIHICVKFSIPFFPIFFAAFFKSRNVFWSDCVGFNSFQKQPRFAAWDGIPASTNEGGGWKWGVFNENRSEFASKFTLGRFI